MIGRIIKLPFLVLKFGVDIVLKILSFTVVVILGIGRFIFSRIFGTIFGAIVGFFLGKRHVGIKLFTRKKKDK